MSHQEISNIVVIGSGKLGTDIFYYLLEFDFRLSLICIDEEEAEKQKAFFQKRINRQLKTGMIDDQRLQFLQESVCIDYNYEMIPECDLIIECIWENKLQKQKLFKAIVPFLNNRFILF